jgi:arylsulfatase
MPGELRRAAAGRIFAVLPVCALLALGSISGCADPGPTRPNLLLVTVDSLRADVLRCYGGEPSVGLQLCTVGDRGARFIWAFSPSSESAPSIASLLSSTYPRDHQLDGSAASFLPEAIRTLPEELRRAGYATAAFIGSPELNRSRNLHQGFDVYDDRLGERDPPRLAERRAASLTDAAIAWLQESPEPWFLWIHYRDPHGPYDAPASGRTIAGDGPSRADRGTRIRRGERLRVLSTASGRGGIPGYQALPGLFTREAYEDRYRAEVRYVDGQLTRLLAIVDASDAATGVMVTADHGEAFGEDSYFFTHGHSVGLEQIRVPLLWRPPDGARSLANPAPVSTLDIAPTLLQASGSPVPASFEGSPLPMQGDPPRAPGSVRAIFAEGPRQLAVVAGGVYYARNRVVDRLSPAARVAYFEERAATSGREYLPRYEAGASPTVAGFTEPLLAEFLSASPDRAPDTMPDSLQ